MNRPTYFEIHAEDLSRAQRFYSDIFGWKFEKWENKATGSMDYYQINTGDSEPGINGGLLRKPVISREGVPPNAFVITISVGDIDETIKKIVTAEGKEAMGKFPLPGIGWTAYYLDTEGNIFGIFQEDKKAE
jgi:predicted enzyme related to lactoylglutathione lyase